MHCSWCNSTEHNARTCELKKAGIKPIAGNSSPPAPYVIQTEDQADVEMELELPITQVNDDLGPEEMSQETMMSQFLSQVVSSLYLHRFSSLYFHRFSTDSTVL
jgi:hypothetical protein